MRSIRTIVAILLLLPAASAAERDLSKIGHSAHGAAFDEGPRQKPWRMTGIGKSHFPITTAVPEVQEWFDQGNTLLHSYWYFEAERAFRWCLKLEPGNAMAYWGLVRSTGGERQKSFLRQAVQRKDSVSARERMYIEAWEEALAPGVDFRERNEILRHKLEMIILEYPDDLEAKALFVNQNLGSETRIGNEMIIRHILAANPEHPGAHHYRVHNWDGPEGVQALESCRTYGRLAFEVGHANHMPGHVYSGIGMWHEAAIWMDSATRVEKKYMQKRLTMPFNAWNYAHNRNYLSYLQEQLGMPEASISGARQLLAAPLDPKYNDADRPGAYNCYRQGLKALIRATVKFEQWDEILRPGHIPWRDNVEDRAWKAYMESLAHMAKGELLQANDAFQKLKSMDEEVIDTAVERSYAIMLAEAEGLLMLTEGESVKAIGKLTEAAEKEIERRSFANDPPSYPRPVYNVLGRAYLKLGSPLLAAEAFKRTLKTVPNEAFALLGLAESYKALGELEKASDYYGRLLHVWAGAEPGLKALAQARSLGLTAQPKDVSPEPQRNYRTTTLESLGPEVWEPYPAPRLDALDVKGQKVTLQQYRGKNVVLIFYLGSECPHCVDQLVAVKNRYDDFEAIETVVLAISSDTPEDNRETLELDDVPFTLLSDQGFANAKRFHSYDEFEEIELHSTIFIDRQGRVRWARTGGDPFMELDFLLGEIERVEQATWQAVPSGAGN